MMNLACCQDCNALLGVWIGHCSIFQYPGVHHRGAINEKVRKRRFLARNYLKLFSKSTKATRNANGNSITK